MSTNQLIMLHIPKTGGSTLLERYRGVTGITVSHEVKLFLDPTARYGTVIREPIAHLVSSYNHHISQSCITNPQCTVDFATWFRNRFTMYPAPYCTQTEWLIRSDPKSTMPDHDHITRTQKHIDDIMDPELGEDLKLTLELRYAQQVQGRIQARMAGDIVGRMDHVITGDVVQEFDRISGKTPSYPNCVRINDTAQDLARFDKSYVTWQELPTWVHDRVMPEMTGEIEFYNQVHKQ